MMMQTEMKKANLNLKTTQQLLVLRRDLLNTNESCLMKNSTSHMKWCGIFLLGLLNKALDPTLSVYRQFGVPIPLDNNMKIIDNLKEKLFARSGRDQMLLFLTGPAGAGKTSAVKAVEQFCFEVYSLCNKMWSDTSFIYTAYTGSAASTF